MLAMFAGVAVLCVGTTAAAVARAHPATRLAPLAQCQNACVSVYAATSTVAGGHAALFGIDISPSSVLDEVTVRIAVISSGPPFPAPTFTSCGYGAGTQTCAAGLLQAGQATDLSAQVQVPGTAPGGETATLSATVTWSLLGVIGTGSATGSATIEVASTQPSPSPTPHPTPTGSHPSPTPTGSGHPGSPPPGTHPGGRPPGHGSGGPAADGRGAASSRLGARLGPLALSRMPLLTLEGGRSSVNPAGLFPRIYPSPTPTASGHSRRVPAARRLYHATAVADILPLTMRQVSAQAAGLIVLALGILIAVVRVPLRRRRSPGGEP